MKKRKLFVLLCLGIFALTGNVLVGDGLSLPAVFSDNMVLQRDKPVPVWGRGKTGETVTVELNSQSKSVKVDGNGSWSLKLDAMGASKKSLTMLVKSGSDEKKINNILIGEVWVCSGQSNMEWAMGWGAVDNKAEEMKNAKYPQIRFIDAPHVVSGIPRQNIGANWQVCSPKTIGRFSAVGYFFGRDLFKELDLPIGLIGANWGGTAIEPWTPESGFKAIPGFQKTAQTINWKNDHYKKDLKKSFPAIKAWVERVEKDESLLEKTAPDMPLHKLAFDLWLQPTTLYNGMLSPFVPLCDSRSNLVPGRSKPW